MSRSIPTIVEYHGKMPSHSCGYCKSKGVLDEGNSVSHGMSAASMTVGDYQILLDRGWRRCPVDQFSLSRSQKKTLKHVNRFLLTGERPKVLKSSPMEDGRSSKSNCSKINICSSLNCSMPNEIASGREKPVKRGKDIRREKKREKLLKKGIDPQNNVSYKKSIEDFLAEAEKQTSPKHKLEVQLIQSAPTSPEFKKWLSQSYKVYWRYQVTIHCDPPEKPSLRQFQRFLCESPLKVKLLPTNDLKRTWLPQSAALFQKYQMAIHKEPAYECDRGVFEAFLVDTPLQSEKPDIPDHPGYGSFHQIYLLDGKLIAVGVIDLLTRCLSSKYLYYDPEYEFLRLGTYSALREIAFTKQLTKLDPNLRFYYMGYYIHDCPKMRYKAKFGPAELLCPETASWQPFEGCAPLLDANKYARLNPDFTCGMQTHGIICNIKARQLLRSSLKIVNFKGSAWSEFSLDNVGILYQRQALNFQIFEAIRSAEGTEVEEDEKEEVKEYSTLVGPLFANSALLYRA